MARARQSRPISSTVGAPRRLARCFGTTPAGRLTSSSGTPRRASSSRAHGPGRWWKSTRLCWPCRSRRLSMTGRKVRSVSSGSRATNRTGAEASRRVVGVVMRAGVYHGHGGRPFAWGRRFERPVLLESGRFHGRGGPETPHLRSDRVSARVIGDLVVKHRTSLAVAILGAVAVSVAAMLVPRPTAPPLVIQQPTPRVIPTAAPPPTPAAPSLIVVHLSGEVIAPGVYELPVGARVDDAVKAAGGVTPAGDVHRVNL